MNEQDAKKIAAKMKEKTARLKRDPQAARRLLTKAGIIDKNGEIHQYYRSA